MAALLAPACGGDAPAPSSDPASGSPEARQAADRGALRVPRADVSAMEEASRRRIEQAQAEVEELLSAAGERPAELAAAFGRLGHLYFAFEFHGPAESAYRNAARLAPGEHRWHYYLGMLLQAAGRPAEAAAAFRDALGLTPDDLPARLRLGEVLLELPDLEGARRAFRVALEHEPASAAAHYGLGRVEARAGATREAIRHLERALELAPEASAVHYQLGQLHRRAGDLERARAELELAGDRGVTFPDPLGREVGRARVTTAFEVVRELARDPEALGIDDLLGFAIVQFGDIDGALAEFRRILESGDAELDRVERARTRYVLGALHLRRLEPEAALPHLRAALEADPEFAPARVQLASALGRLGRTEEALEEVGRVLARRPDDPAALLRRGAILLEEGRAEEAEEPLRRLLEVEPGHGEGRLRLASALGRLGDEAGAREQYRRALELDLERADAAEAHRRLGDLLRRAGEEEAAVTHYRDAVRLDPGLTAARRELGAALARRGRPGDALEHYRAAVEAEPGDPVARLGEASCLILLGRHDEARRRLEEALGEFPDDLRLAHTLARHLAACPDRGVRDGARAVELARRVMAGEPTAEAAETLAMALAEAGSHAEAAGLQAELVARLEAAGAAEGELERLRANLERYRAGQACCAEAG